MTPTPPSMPSSSSASMPMRLHMIGCSHHDVPVDVRERLAFSDSDLLVFYEQFAARFPGGEAVLVNTCNRVELYVVSAPPATPASPPTVRREELVDLIADVLERDRDFVGQHLTSRVDREAVDHLFLVASSLDSMILGEAQVLSQVKHAYDFAQSVDATGPVTHAIFQAANKAAKRVQTETTIHRRRLSVPSVAIGEVVPEVFETLRGKRVVLCGAGEMAAETLRYLRAGGADNLCLLNRNLERGVALAQEFGADVQPFDSLVQQVVGTDLLIGTTAAEHPILTAADFASIRTARGGRTLLVLDLAVPRDFDPAIGDESGVYLYQIDDLQAACNRNRREREKQWPKAKRIIDEEVELFTQSIRQRETGPIIRRLRERADRVKQEELDRLLGKLNGSQDPAIAKEIEKSFDRLTNKLLHPPLASLRDDAADGHSRGLLEALRHLFNLGDDA